MAVKLSSQAWNSLASCFVVSCWTCPENLRKISLPIFHNFAGKYGPKKAPLSQGLTATSQNVPYFPCDIWPILKISWTLFMKIWWFNSFIHSFPTRLLFLKIMHWIGPDLDESCDMMWPIPLDHLWDTELLLYENMCIWKYTACIKSIYLQITMSNPNHHMSLVYISQSQVYYCLFLLINHRSEALPRYRSANEFTVRISK